MWSLHASPGHSASILGVGHFTVPVDVTVTGRDGVSPASARVEEPSPIIRNLIVPHDIVAVPRRSPIKARKRTPWHPEQTHVVVERADRREWFSEKLIVESQQASLPAACSTSAMVHVVLVIVVVLVVLAARAARADMLPRPIMNVSLRMPVLESLMLVTVAPPPAPKHVVERVSSVQQPPPPIARTLPTEPAVPLETPSSIAAEAVMLAEAPVEGAADGHVSGATDGVTGGVAGGTGSGAAIEPASAPAVTGPFRVGDGIDRPRKVKHVKPVYPVQAQSARVGGNVLIEATIGVDGKVHDARVLQSIALLDQAALDAVRQWEFDPSRVNGVPVAVTMVIVVTFALL